METNKMPTRDLDKYNFYMGSKDILVPDNPIVREAEKLKLEKEAEEAKKLFLELEKEKQKEINARLETLEILPMGNKVILLPYPTNPYKQVLKGEIIVDYAGLFKNPDSGELDTLEQGVVCGKIIEIGPEVKYLKPGDDVYYDNRTCYPIPFMSSGYKLTSEPQILCVLNDGLKKRFKMNQDTTV